MRAIHTALGLFDARIQGAVRILGAICSRLAAPGEGTVLLQPLGLRALGAGGGWPAAVSVATEGAQWLVSCLAASGPFHHKDMNVWERFKEKGRD